MFCIVYMWGHGNNSSKSGDPFPQECFVLFICGDMGIILQNQVILFPRNVLYCLYVGTWEWDME